MVRITVHLKALDLSRAVEEDYQVNPLFDNPTMNLMKNNKENKTSKTLAKVCLHFAVSPLILTRIM